MLDQSRQYELLVRPLGRATADEYYHNGAIWIEGREGNRYTIDIKNNTYRRVMFVVSVDGLDVLEGKPAGLESRGYVLNAQQSISIPGWVLDKQQAADFFFSRNRSSYVNSIGGSTANTGVIGAMVFSEKIDMSWLNHGILYNGQPTPFPGIHHPTHVYPNWSGIISNIGVNNLQATQLSSSVMYGRGSSLGPAGGGPTAAMSKGPVAMNCSVPVAESHISASPVSQDIGTGFGEAHEWKTVDVTFNKANPQVPDCTLALYYNTAKNLEKMGIALRRKHNTAHKANPFPAYSPTSGCKPPPGWND